MPDIFLDNLQNNNRVYYPIFLEFWFCQNFGDISSRIKEFIEYKMEDVIVALAYTDIQNILGNLYKASPCFLTHLHF